MVKNPTGRRQPVDCLQSVVELNPGVLEQFERGATACRSNALTTGPRLLPKRILNHDAFYEQN